MDIGDSNAEKIPATVSVVLGKDLSSEQLKIINQYRKTEFGSPTAIEVNPQSENWEKPYFLAYAGEQLAAFGRLHDVEVRLQQQTYRTLGIATVVATKKGAGFGKLLMEKMKEYIEASGKTAIGFCGPDVSAFYEKCGFSIIKGGVQRVVYMESGKHVPVPAERANGDVIYLSGADNFMQKFNADPSLTLTAFRAPW
jgi:hypothetical protein